MRPEAKQGLFNVQFYKDEWYFQIPDSLLGRPFRSTTRFVATPVELGVYGGELVNSHVLYWELQDKKLMLRALAYDASADSTSQIYRALVASTETPIVAAFKLGSIGSILSLVGSLLGGGGNGSGSVDCTLIVVGSLLGSVGSSLGYVSGSLGSSSILHSLISRTLGTGSRLGSTSGSLVSSSGSGSSLVGSLLGSLCSVGGSVGGSLGGRSVGNSGSSLRTSSLGSGLHHLNSSSRSGSLGSVAGSGSVLHGLVSRALGSLGSRLGGRNLRSQRALQVAQISLQCSCIDLFLKVIDVVIIVLTGYERTYRSNQECSHKQFTENLSFHTINNLN